MKSSAFGPRTTPLPRGSGFRPRTASLAPVPFPSGQGPARTPWVQTATTRKPLAPVSPKRARENRTRKTLAKALFPEDPRCAVPWCTLMADDLHEPLTRARGGSITDAANVLPACRGHNDELTLEPKWAYDLRLLRHSWGVGGEPPAGALTREHAALLFVRDPWCVHCGSTRSLRPHLRQEYGEHQGCVCGWVLLCAGCRDYQRRIREFEDEGLLIPDAVVAPYFIAVAVHLPGDSGGMLQYPSCDGQWLSTALAGAR